MAVFTRPDSPYYWFFNEVTKAKTKTSILAPRSGDGATPAQRKDNERLAKALYQQAVADANAAAVDARLNPAAAAKASRPRITVDAFIDWYDANVVARHRGARQERTKLVILRRAFGTRYLDTITRDDVIAWATQRIDVDGVKPLTAQRDLTVFKSLLKAAVPRYLEVSPLKGLPNLKGQPVRLTLLSHDDEDRLLAEITEPHDQTLIIAALDTLQREGDLLELRREDDHGTYLTFLWTKNGQTHKVPVSSRLRKALDRLVDDGSGYYFNHRRTSVEPSNALCTFLRRVCKRAGLRYGRAAGGFTFHVLRHTGASRMIDRGVPTRIVQQIGGWKSLPELERYSHPSDQALVNAVEQIGQAPLRLVKKAS